MDAGEVNTDVCGWCNATAPAPLRKISTAACTRCPYADDHTRDPARMHAATNTTHNEAHGHGGSAPWPACQPRWSRHGARRETRALLRTFRSQRDLGRPSLPLIHCCCCCRRAASACVAAVAPRRSDQPTAPGAPHTRRTCARLAPRAGVCMLSLAATNSAGPLPSPFLSQVPPCPRAQGRRQEEDANGRRPDAVAGGVGKHSDPRR
jgi:hypothetical protein